MRHFFWFDSEVAACEALCRLGREGVTGCAGPKGDRWLIVVSHVHVISPVAALAERFRKLARAYGGEYGGCEVLANSRRGPRLSIA